MDRQRFKRLWAATVFYGALILCLTGGSASFYLKGFLWVGTEYGLCRYDGYSFKPYQYDPEDPSSLSNDYVSAIYEDRSGTLWPGTYYGGLNKLVDRKNGSFDYFRKKDGLPSDTINGIRENWILLPGKARGLHFISIYS